MDHLAPTIADDELLALLGKVLQTNPTPQSTGELRLRFFQPGFSWQALVDLSVAHEVLPPLVFALNQRALLPPVPTALSEHARTAHVTNRLAVAYQQHLNRLADLREQLKVALGALNGEGVVPVLLKGAVHLTLAQPEWHQARGMRDLDILVSAAEADSANRALSALGYRPDADPPPLDRHLPELWLPGHAGTVELHIEALSFPARHALTTEEVWRHAEAGSFAGAAYRALPPEWHLLHGMLHHQLADHGHARRMLAIKGLWEFSRVGADISPRGWRAIIEHAEQRGILDVLSSWAVQAKRLFGLDIPRDLCASAAGRKHAEATFRRARAPYKFRQVASTIDRLRFAFSRETLAMRYGRDRSLSRAGLHHFLFLVRRYRK